MKTQAAPIGKKTKLILAAGATILGFGIAAQAQTSLGIYFINPKGTKKA